VLSSSVLILVYLFIVQWML